MTKPSGRWVSRLRIIDHKRNPVRTSKGCFGIIQPLSGTFFHHFRMVDKALKYISDQEPVVTVEFFRRIVAEEGQGGFVSQQAV